MSGEADEPASPPLRYQSPRDYRAEVAAHRVARRVTDEPPWAVGCAWAVAVAFIAAVAAGVLIIVKTEIL